MAVKTSGRVAVYPGSFDPITFGHIDIVKRFLPLFDEIIILIATNNDKRSLFSFEERKELILEALRRQGLEIAEKIKVDSFAGLTVDYAKKVGARSILRGLRAVTDFEYEQVMANMNRQLAPEIETLIVFASPEFYYVSSRAIKEVTSLGGRVTGLIPENVEAALKKKIMLASSGPGN